MLNRMLIAAAATTTLAVGLLAAPGATASPPAATSTSATAATYVAVGIKWKKCRDGFLEQFRADCGFLEVPLDHADPAGATIKLAVSRVRHRGKKDRGAIFTNPGGPGGSGTFMAGLSAFVPGNVARTYDWYGMDPRGVGDSRPALTCDAKFTKVGSRPPYDPKTDAIRDAWLAKTEKYAADCATADAAELLPHVKTTDTVEDFEVLRRTIGADKVTFYGASYGTYIAQVYATLHPDSLDKLLLDGVVDPRTPWYQGNLDQNLAFEKTIQRFFKWAAKGNKIYRLGKTRKQVEKNYYRILKKATKKPKLKVGPDEISDVTLSAGYGAYAWPSTAELLSAAKGGDFRPIKQVFRGDNPTSRGR